MVSLGLLVRVVLLMIKKRVIRVGDPKEIYKLLTRSHRLVLFMGLLLGVCISLIHIEGVSGIRDIVAFIVLFSIIGVLFLWFRRVKRKTKERIEKEALGGSS